MSHNLDHQFDRAIQLSGDAGRYTGATTVEYANMVGPFGGVLASTLLSAVLKHPECQGEPVALTVNFAAPVTDGEFDITAVPVRTSRSTQHWTMSLMQNREVAMTATAIFALRRKTWEATDSDMPQVQGPDDLVALPEVMPIPKLFSNYDIRMVRGNIAPLPQAEAYAKDSSESVLWVRDKPTRVLDFPSLTAMADIFFPRIFVRRQRPAAAGTISLTIHFHADSRALAAVGDSFVLGHARAKRFYNGYADQTGEVWSKDGVLLATTSQTVYFKE